jgi:DNA-3-methyladenine glycosylase II
MGAQGPADATAETVLSDAEAFLVRVDPKLKTLVEKHRCGVFTPEGLSEVVEPFEKLTSGIIGQQVCCLLGGREDVMYCAICTLTSILNTER